MIVLLSLTAGGQRPQFVHLLQYDQLDYTVGRGWFVNLPAEKVVRVSGSRVPLPSFLAVIWGWYVKNVRPVLMSSAQREAWDQLQNCQDKLEKKELMKVIDKHMFLDTHGNGAGKIHHFYRVRMIS